MVIKETKKIRELKHKSRRLSISEGIIASAKDAVGFKYIQPFAIAINASNSLVAMLSSITGLIGPLTQIYSSKLMKKHSRKKIVLKSVFAESLVWLLIASVGILYFLDIIPTILPLVLLIFFGIYSIVSNITSPPWFSWTGDIVDEEFRGRWFSKRNLLISFTAVVVSISAAFFLDYMKTKNWAIQGFVILFVIAFIARMFCWKIFKKQYHPKLKIKKQDYFSFWQFLKQMPKNNFGKFTLFRSTLSFAISVSSPLLVVYLLRNLGFSYKMYIIMISMITVFSLLVSELWGKFADKYGNYRVMSITTLLIPLIPLMWILFKSPLYLLLVPPIISGISWAGFNLAERNFIYDNVTPQKRAWAFSYYNLLNGIGIFLGAGIGAILIKVLNTNLIEPILLIFIIGTILRMAVVHFWIPQIKEARKMQKLKSSKEFTKFILKQAKPTLMDEAHQIATIGKYFK